ncbi:MAG: MFS transporter [Candidatus Limnocylindria bacterium]
MLAAGRRLLFSFTPPQLRVLSRGDNAAIPPPLPPAPGGGFRRGFAALRHRNYRYYWLGQIVSLVGTWMQSVSQPWLVLLLGGDAFQLGTVIALQFAPAMVLAPLGGVLADRIDKRRALIGAQVVAMVQASILFGLTVTGVVEIWHVMVLAAMLGVVNAVEMPMRQSFAAELVPREDLMNAIALNSASFNLARVVGPAVAGIGLALFGPAFNFGVNAVSYLAVLFGLSRMDYRPVRRLDGAEPRQSVRSSLAEGLRYAARTPSVLWPLVLLGGMSTFAMNFQTLLPLFARNTLGLGAEGYGALFAAMGAGALIGSMWLAYAGSGRPLVGLILGGAVFFIGFEVALGLTRSALVAYPLVLALGLASMLMVNTINVTIQNSVSDELRGRVMSLYVTVFAGSAPIGGFFAGAVAQLWGPPAGFVLGAIVASAFVGLVSWKLLVRGGAGTDTAAARVGPAATEPPGGRRAANQ